MEYIYDKLPRMISRSSIKGNGAKIAVSVLLGRDSMWSRSLSGKFNYNW